MSDSLILGDGRRFHGTGFGAAKTTVGEVVLYTGVVGWQEVLTDPSYAGKIVVFTYPLVGNYGVNDEDAESSEATVRGIVVRDLARFHSNFRAKGSLRSWVEQRGIVGLEGIDTRAVMVHARDHGIGMGAITSDEEGTRRTLLEAVSPFATNLVAEAQGICRWPQSTGLRLGVLDLGGKYSLYRQMAELGCDLRFFPWDSSAEMIVASGVVGLLLPPGPGDPNRLGEVAGQVARLVGKLPILGIGLGYQLLALAMGARVTRLKAGRHGVNYPVGSTRGEPSMIVACHHSFAIQKESAPPEMEFTHFHMNEGTPMGLEAKSLRAWGYQFHPGRDENNCPSPLLARFAETVRRGQETDHA